jgi:thioredoxin reductase (NADPH)
MKKSRDYDIIIIGSGAAGLSAGIAAASAETKSLILEKDVIGGELAITDKIETYPGFPDGISGFSLSKLFERQFHQFRGKLIRGEVLEISGTKEEIFVITDSDTYFCKALILAMGTQSPTLNIAGEERFLGNGIYSSALTYGERFRDKSVVVFGNTDRAARECLYLSQIVNQIYLIISDFDLSFSSIYREKIHARSNVKIFSDAAIQEFIGNDALRAVLMKDKGRNEYRELDVDAVFVSMKRVPNINLVKGGIELDEESAIIVNSRYETNLESIFAAGAICQNFSGDLISAIHDGTKAGWSAAEYLLV